MGFYKNVQDFRKLDVNGRDAYLYDIVKSAGKGEKLSEDTKIELNELIKTGLIKQKNILDVIKDYKFYKKK